ncbi:mechanosensitive ion channel family protein [Fulvivirgaceae bacterium LMO-SS25]
MDLGSFDPQKINELVLEFIIDFGPKLLGAILILLIGTWLIGKIGSLIRKGLDKGSFEPSLKSFLTSLTRFALYVMLFITVLGTVGIPMTSFLTILGAAGLAIGLALQGSLSNFAGGVLILAFKPFRIGDVIEAQGEIGTVEKIDILHTRLNTADNREIIMPNGSLANSNIINITAHPTRRVAFPVGISYDSDIKQARKIIVDTLSKDPRVLPEQGVQVVLTELADSSLNLSVRVWVNAEDFWSMTFEGLEDIKEALDVANIEIPFPQRDVHMKQQ